MYIKKVTKQNKTSNKKYEYLHLIESVRTENGPRQRLILNLGKIDIPKDKYKELANCIESVMTGQEILFSSDPIIEEQARIAVKKINENAINEPNDDKTENFIPVDVNSVDHSETRSFGAEFVCHEMWNQLEFNKILTESNIPETVIPIIEALVIGRLVAPSSERETHYWAEKISSIFELTKPAKRRSLNSFYRAGDRLFAIKDSLEQHLSIKEKELFDLKEKILLMDLTNTYFEGEMISNPKAKRGHSKEKRSDCKLLTLALIIDEQGFPKYSRLYPGNQSEFQTFKEMIESLIKLKPELAKDRTVIVDKGIASKENIEYLKESGIHYIIINRGKHDYSISKDMKILKEDKNKGVKIEVKRYETDEETHLFCRSIKRMGKENGIRGRQEKIFLEKLQYLKSGLKSKNRTKIHEKVVEKIGQLKAKYAKVAKLYEVKITISKEKNKRDEYLTEDIVWSKIEGKYDNAIELEGSYLLRTDLKELTDKEIWETYMMLTKIENSFRNMKSFLGARPNFHQREDRADTHLFISVIAYHILHSIEFKLRQNGDYRGWSTIRNILSSHVLTTITFNALNENKRKKYHLRAPGVLEIEHKKIYEKLGVNPNKIKRKLVIV